MIQGDRVNLRAIEREDLPLLRDLRNNTEINQYFRTWEQLNMKDQEKYFDNYVMGDNHVVFGIYLQCRSCLIGDCRLSYINWQARNSEAGIYIAPKYQNRGFGSESLSLLVDFGFKQANLHRITAEVRADNSNSISLFEGAGFQREGYCKDSFFRNGKFYDTVMLALIKEPARLPESFSHHIEGK